MRRIEQLLNEYGESHKNKINIFIHAIAVPVIYFVSLALIWSIPTPDFIAFFDVTWAHVVSIPVLYYYFMLSGPIGAAMTLLTFAVFLLINLMEGMGIGIWQASLAIFVVMWVLQFVGHHIEGKRPSFLADLRFLLVAPAWWWVHWLRRMNIHY